MTNELESILYDMFKEAYSLKIHDELLTFIERSAFDECERVSRIIKKSKSSDNLKENLNNLKQDYNGFRILEIRRRFPMASSLLREIIRQVIVGCTQDAYILDKVFETHYAVGCDLSGKKSYQVSCGLTLTGAQLN